MVLTLVIIGIILTIIMLMRGRVALILLMYMALIVLGTVINMLFSWGNLMDILQDKELEILTSEDINQRCCNCSNITNDGKCGVWDRDVSLDDVCCKWDWINNNSIFDFDWLKPEMINTNYRGIKGLSVLHSVDNGTEFMDCGDVVIAFFSDPYTNKLDAFLALDGYTHEFNRYVKIKKFSYTDLIGELCWLSNDGCRWDLQILKSCSLTDFKKGMFIGLSNYKYCVPHLIADSEEEAMSRRSRIDFE